MKILYELNITEETGFTASDFPDRFEILREGKTPLVWKPVALSMQDIYNRLNEAEELLKQARNINDEAMRFKLDILSNTINEYFERYSQ